MRMYISPSGLRPAEESDEELLDYYCPPDYGRLIRTPKNMALFYKVINHKDVYLRDPHCSMEHFHRSDFIINSTPIFIQSFPKSVNDDTRLILSSVENTTSIGLELYVHTVATSYINGLYRRNIIDDFLNDNV